MEEQELTNLFTSIHGNINPVVDELVHEYSSSFDISFKFFK
jgi:hypothetical protein